MRRTDGGLVVAGEIDHVSAPTLAAEMAPLVAQGGHVPVNLRDVTFMGIAGVQVLDDAAETLGHRGLILVLDPSSVVRRVIELIGLHHAIDITPPLRQ